MTDEHVNGAGTVVGDVLDGYTIVRRIRVRGCSAVYQATIGTETVALKTLCRGSAPRLQARMDNEIAALRMLDRCAAAPTLTRTAVSGPQRYLAMSWRAGRSLRRHTATAIEDLAVPVCEAYDALHRCGVVHGDVSRHNILVDDRHGVVLVDFESSSRTTDTNDRLRRRFTWAYAAPEFATDAATPNHQQPTPASDQYAVAAVLYRQLTGRYPRPVVAAKPDSPSALRVRAQPLTGEAARHRPGLRAVFAKALRLRPSARFDDMAEFAAALKRCR